MSQKSKSSRVARISASVAAVAVASAATVAPAATFTWVGGTTGNVRTYSTAANWNPSTGAPPGASDIALFDSTGTNYSTSSGISSISNRTIGQIAMDGTPSFQIGTGAAGASSFTLVGDGSTANVALRRTAGTLNNQEIINNLILGNAAANAAVTFDISGSGGLLRLSGALVNGTGLTSSVTKTGNGVVSLGGANSYSGTTAVNAGTLYVNGVTSGADNFTVAAGATLGGTGTIGLASTSNSVTVSGNLTPGNFTAQYGTLTVGNGSVTLAGTSTFDINFTDLRQDKLIVAGNVAFGGTLNVALVGDTSAGGSFDLFDFGTQSGAFAVSYTGLAEGQAASFDPSTGVVTIAAVPEPASVGLVAGFGGLLLARRRRSSQA